MAERVLFHFLAGDAPVGVKIEHAVAPLLRRAVERQLQAVAPLDLAKREVLAGRFASAADRRGNATQRLQQVATAGGRADQVGDAIDQDQDT